MLAFAAFFALANEPFAEKLSTASGSEELSAKSGQDGGEYLTIAFSEDFDSDSDGLFYD